METKTKNVEQQIMDALAAPFEKTMPDGTTVPDVKWLPSHKVGNNKMECVAYVTGAQVRGRLNEIMGARWQDRMEKHEDRTICILSLYINDEWMDRSDVGTPTAVEKEKGEATDALKRAAKNWGVGAYVDALPKIIIDTKRIEGKNVPVTPNGTPLLGDDLSNYINTLSLPMGKLIELWHTMSKEQQGKVEKEVVKIKSVLSPSATSKAKK